MTAHIKPEQTARSVLDALRRAGARGLTLYDLIDATGLTTSQVRRGLGYLRETLPDLKNSNAVYSYSPRGHLYRTQYDQEAVEAYELMRIAGESTRSYRILTGTVIPHAKQSKAKQIRLLRRHLQLVVDETNDILEPG
ncbi:hypothetical protein ACWCV5_32575 [Streptomyces tubercidicus]|uniref:Uncharacterized protein n=1 Tax=Streptomyces caniferus TaxID=285557 RepID=A0A640S6L8_9ACTN|nr:hypothetical protein [Streptomyces caniferus]GFE07123.1 hypothetical protein Scani_33910 [Streptomyces caniferus]